MSEQDFAVPRAEASEGTPAASRQGYGLTVCLDWNRMLVHRKTIRALGHPRRIRLLINPGTRHLCVQGCDEKEACSFPVPQDLASLQESFYIHSKFLLGQICALMGWNPALSYRVFGKINTYTNVLDFDLNQHMEVKLNEFLENDEVPEEFMKEYRGLSAPVQGEMPAENAVMTKPPVPAFRATEPRRPGFMGSLFDSAQILRKGDEGDD